MVRAPATSAEQIVQVCADVPAVAVVVAATAVFELAAAAAVYCRCQAVAVQVLLRVAPQRRTWHPSREG